MATVAVPFVRAPGFSADFLLDDVLDKIAGLQAENSSGRAVSLTVNGRTISIQDGHSGQVVMIDATLRTIARDEATPDREYGWPWSTQFSFG